MGTVDPLGRTRAQTFAPAGNRVSLTDGSGATSAYSYDALHRLTQIAYADGGAVGYAYDRVGNRTALFDSLGTTAYGYDRLYRLIETTDPFGATVGREYDAVGNRTSRRDRAPGPPEWDYAYDAADQLVAVFRDGTDPADIADAHGPVTRFSYDGNGSMVRRQRGPDFTTYSWSQASTLTQVREREAKGTVFTYDGDGRLYQELETNSSGHPDPGAGRSLTHTLDLPMPSEDSQRADRANLVPPPFELGQAGSLISPALLPAPRPVLIGQGQHPGVTAAGLPLEPIVRLPWPHRAPQTAPALGMQPAALWATPSASAAFAASVWAPGEPGALDGYTPAGGAATAMGTKFSAGGWWQWADGGSAYSSATAASLMVGGTPNWSAPRVPVPTGGSSSIASTRTSTAWRASTQTTPHTIGLAVEERHLTQILQTFSFDNGGPREDTGTYVYGTERGARAKSATTAATSGAATAPSPTSGAPSSACRASTPSARPTPASAPATSRASSCSLSCSATAANARTLGSGANRPIMASGARPWP